MSKSENLKNIFAEKISETTLENVDKLLSAINEKLENAEILNGGFDKLKQEVDEIKSSQIRIESEVSNISKESHILGQKLDIINQSIYDPDIGIYRKINDSNIFDSQRDDKIVKVITEIDQIQKDIEPIKFITKSLNHIGGDDLKEISEVIKVKKAFSKIVWAIVLGLCGGVVTLMIELIYK